MNHITPQHIQLLIIAGSLISIAINVIRFLA